MTIRRVTVLGSTGSIGKSTLDLVAANPEKFPVDTLVANRNVALLAEQAKSVKAKRAVVADEKLYDDLKAALSGSSIEAAAGGAAVIEAAAGEADWIMSAIVGIAGLKPTMAAVRAGKTVALANKESMVCAGPLMMAEAQKSGAVILPADSEHNAIFQVLDRRRPETVSRLILTASGGPFRTKRREELENVTPEQALRHPNWSMGAKISTDSATMMNKALEVIEAHYLFDMPPERIEVVIHPQSIVHSMVEYIDGSILAQMGTPDMRTPIAVCLAWPDRMEGRGGRLSFTQNINFEFQNPDLNRFISLRLAYEALQRPDGPVTLSAANEVAVEAFLQGRIGFLDIEKLNAEVLEKLPVRSISSLEDVFAADAEARAVAAAGSGALQYPLETRRRV